MVAEKPSLAKTLAELLAERDTLHSRQGRCTPVHEFVATVLGHKGQVWWDLRHIYAPTFEICSAA